MGKQQAKQLWGAKERGILDFEDIAPVAGLMPAGGVGVCAGRTPR